MSVVINGIRDIDDKIQLCFLTITYDGQDCKSLANTPVLAGSALQVYADNKEDRWVYNILYQEYPGARYKQLEGNSDFAKLQQWIADGHTNTAHCSIDEHETEQDCIDAECTWISAEVIEKVPFIGAHPAVFPSSGAEKTNLAAAAKNLADNLTFSQVDSYIDTEFSNLSATQRMFLKKQAKAVLFLLKRGN